MTLSNRIQYLGGIFCTHGSTRPAVESRVQMAQSVHERLTPKIYRSKIYPLHQKVEAYKVFELTVLLSGLDVRTLGYGDIDILERWQMRKLRHLSNSPAHITRETNFALRKRLGVYTITSTLRLRRLLFFRNVLLHPQTNEQLIAAIYGTVEWDMIQPNTSNNTVVKMLHDDICTAWQTVASTHNVPDAWENTFVGPNMQTWLTTCTRTQLQTVLTYQNPRDNSSAIPTTQTAQTQETGYLACPDCDTTWKNAHSLAMHKLRKHGIANPLRAQVAGSQCPGCNKQFSNAINAKSHWAKQICVRNSTAHSTPDQVQATIDNVHSVHDQPRTVPGLEIAALVRRLFASLHANRRQGSSREQPISADPSQTA